MKITSKILVLVLACMMLLTSCGTDDKKEENKATAPATETTTATAVNTDAPTATATNEPTTETTKVPVTETPENPVTTEETTATTKPTKNPSVIIQPTDKPTEKPTIKPTSTSKPTVSPTNKPTETAKPTTPVPTTTPTPTATAKPTPTLDPSVDYSKWGKHGFENLLPIPLPFSDEEADWRSKKETQKYFKVQNFKMIYFKNPDDFVSAIKEYAESYESLGYTIISEQYIFTVYSLEIGLFSFTCSANGYVNIEISLL